MTRYYFKSWQELAERAWLAVVGAHGSNPGATGALASGAWGVPGFRVQICPDQRAVKVCL